MFFQRKSKKDLMVEARRRRREPKKTTDTQALPEAKRLCLWISILFVIAATFIGFFGHSPESIHLRPNQISPTRIVAEFSFQYESDRLTQKKIETEKKQLAPVYRINMSRYESYREYALKLAKKLNLPKKQNPETVLNNLQKNNSIPATNESATSEKTSPDPASAKRLIASLRAEDVQTIIESVFPQKRSELLREGLKLAEGILQRGVYEAESEQSLSSQLPYLMRLDADQSPSISELQSQAQALRELRMNLSAISPDSKVAGALFRILKPVIKPNIAFDPEATAERRLAVEKKIEPVTISVREGQLLVRPGERISEEQAELLAAYRNAEQERESQAYGVDRFFLYNLLLISGLMIAVGILTKMTLPELLQQPRSLGLLLGILLINLITLRGMHLLGDAGYLVGQTKLVDLLNYASPFALGTLLSTIILGVGAGVISTVIISSFYAMMHGYSYEFLMLGLMCNAVTILYSKNIRFRANIVKAGTMAGLTAAAVVILSGIINQSQWGLVTQQVTAAILMGAVTGILGVGLLTLLENSFRFTTDITLLELTDFNHPLLRRMQMIAPGSYHHSLMVANLAERAAAEVGVNPLKCRVYGLFHDIGKMVKPEYFIENQKPGVNPHVEKNPSMSALVIKSHIKEGLILAKQHKLPRVILDAIEQHHGTSLIWFFYHRARQAQEQQKQNGSSSDPFNIDESNYRYDGPRPKTRENAILLLADSVEAASRTLKKPSSSSVEELVNKIFDTHLRDGQLDRAPLTMLEIKQVKQSLVFTLLNTLHQRTAYPDRGQGKPHFSTQVGSPREPEALADSQDRLMKEKEDTNATEEDESEEAV